MESINLTIALLSAGILSMGIVGVLASRTLAGSCPGIYLSVAIYKKDYYHFFSVWPNEESLRPRNTCNFKFICKPCGKQLY